MGGAFSCLVRRAGECWDQESVVPTLPAKQTYPSSHHEYQSFLNIKLSKLSFCTIKTNPLLARTEPRALSVSIDHCCIELSSRTIQSSLLPRKE